MGDMKELVSYRGKKLEDMSREELIEALKFMAVYYQGRLETKDNIIQLRDRKK